MNIRTLLQWAISKLRASASPALDAEVLLSFVLKKPKEFLLAHPEAALNSRQMARCKKLIQRRAKGEPVAYLTGRKEFYGLDFEVNKNVLIPRPETELMVEEVLKIINRPNTILVDVGAGSGCILIAILKNLEPNLKNKSRAFAVDVSAQALRVARRNARKHGVKIKFMRGNLLAPVFKKMAPKNPLIIAANLPYLNSKQIKKEPSIIREPRSALYGGKDGLKFYRTLLKQTPKNCSVFLEIDPLQTNALWALIKKYCPRAKIQIKKDLAGRNRLIIIHYPA